MILHQDKTLFNQAIRATAERLALLPIYVEKDYWVTLALWHIFHVDSLIAQQVVFKGGTALSKCFHIIERFSEDIDLVLLQSESLSDSQLKRQLKAITKQIDIVLPEIEIPGLTHKRGMIRKTAHEYPQQFSGEFGQVRQHIVVECSWLGNYEPYQDAQIISFVGQMMIATGLTNIAEQQGLMSFTVKALTPERTFCEKIMSLVRFSYSDDPAYELGLKIRHCYDLHQLLQQTTIQDFLNSEKFDVMLEKVRQDDIASQTKNRAWLERPIGTALIFSNLDNMWKQLIPVYERDFKDLVYGKFPEANSVLQTLTAIKKRIEVFDTHFNNYNKGNLK